MQWLATTAQIKELDRIAIEERGIPSLTLMERAAQAVAQAVQELVWPDPGMGGGAFGQVGMTTAQREHTPEENAVVGERRTIVDQRSADFMPRVAVFCGPGNNGGDGIAAARLLGEVGYRARAFLVGERVKMTPEAQAMEKKLCAAGGVLEPFAPEDQNQSTWLSTCDCMVDALFGVGLKRPIEGAFLTAVQAMNRWLCPVVACDVPSGLDADTGEVLGEAVRAKRTVAFTCAKLGLYLGLGRAYSGRVQVADIGLPNDLVHALVSHRIEVAERLEKGRYVLPRRPRTAHKGDFGRVFILAGSEGYTGAPVLCARAAVRTGAGLVVLGVPRDVYPIVAAQCDGEMPFPLPEHEEEILVRAAGCDVALIGPGLGRRPETQRLVLSLLADLNLPVVLDADGINALSGHIDILDKRAAPTVLTPHDGEFRQLTGCQLPLRDRLAVARDFAMAHRCILVLKGHATVTAAPDGRAWINATGNPGMAKGGAGDVLAGMIAALLGQKHLKERYTSHAELAAAGVYYHGLAGDRCAEKLGEYAMTPSDMLEALPGVLLGQEER